MKKVFTTALIALLASSSVCMAYTAEDVTAAGKDAAKLTLIINDAGTEPIVKYAAVLNLSPDKGAAFLDAPWQSDTDPARLEREYALRSNLFEANALPVNQHGRAAFLGSQIGGTDIYGAFYQRKLVEKLVTEGRVDEALGEARRLYGITPVTSVELTSTVNLVATVLKAKALKDGKGLKEGIAAVNQYLETVQKGEESRHPFAATPIPAAPANVAAFENSSNIRRSIWALLYAGKYDEASAKADAYLAVADVDNLPLAINLKAMALNGKAASPAAANAFLESLK